MLLHSNNLTIRAIEETQNKYPSLYFDAVLTTTTKDSAKSIILPTGCTNIKSEAGTANIQCDWEHEGFYTKKNKVKIRNAGVLTSVRVESVDGVDQLIGSFRIGKEHTLVDREGKEYGSSYGSAWMMYASNQVNEKGGSIDDYIPEYITQEFIKSNTIAIKSVSVEIDFGGYPEMNYEDMNGTMHINQFDIISVGFLTHSPPGQSQSVIKQATVEIRSKSNNTNPINTMDINTIRCLCDYQSLYVGQFLHDTVADTIFTVVKATEYTDETQNEYTLENMLTSEQTTSTLETLKENENLESVYTDKLIPWLIKKIMPLLSSTTRSAEAEKVSEIAIRICQSCQAIKQEKVETIIKAEPEAPVVKPETDVKSDIKVEDDAKKALEDDKTANDMQVIMDNITTLTESIGLLTSRIDTLESATTATKSLDETKGEVPAIAVTPAVETTPTEPLETVSAEDDIALRAFKPAVKSNNQTNSALTLRVLQTENTNAGHSALTLKL